MEGFYSVSGNKLLLKVEMTEREKRFYTGQNSITVFEADMNQLSRIKLNPKTQSSGMLIYPNEQFFNKQKGN
jgi:hypothetical protein